MQISTLESYKKIWCVVSLIPVGKVATYGQIADLAGLPGRSRMAGKALGSPELFRYFPEGIPWYRVLRSTGQIAFPVESKHFKEQREALFTEGVTVKGKRVSLKEFGWQPSLDQLLFQLEY